MLHNIKLLRFDCEIMPVHKNLANMSKNIHFINDTNKKKSFIFQLSQIELDSASSCLVSLAFTFTHFSFLFMFSFFVYFSFLCVFSFLSIFDL